VADLVREHEDFLSRFARRGPDTPLGIRAEVQMSANRHLLILRSAVGLGRFLNDLESLQARLEGTTDAERPEDFVHLIETANLIEVGRIMARAALARTESRGSHYREDAPQSDPVQAMSQIIDRYHADGMFRAHLGEL
jgi:L-aspartate oxidase